MPNSSSTIPSPVEIWKDLTAGWRSLALAAAIDLDLFTHIAAGKRTPAEIASAANADARSIERLCDAMAALGYLDKSDGAYALKPLADTYLVRGREMYMENQGTLTRMGLAAVWSQLPDAIRSGKPPGPRDQNATAEFFCLLVKGIFPTSIVPARAAVAALSPSERERIRDILDVAAGSAAWSIPFAQTIAGASVTAIDFPQVLDVTREYVDRYNLSGRYKYVAGDLNELDFGAARYDLVILGHIIHAHGRDEARRLIRKSAAALREGGTMLIAEFVPNDARNGPEIPALFGLNMLLNTPAGDVYTLAEYRRWLEEAGMKSVRTLDAPQPSPLILAGK